jgi:hypothetical protein
VTNLERGDRGLPQFIGPYSKAGTDADRGASDNTDPYDYLSSHAERGAQSLPGWPTPVVHRVVCQVIGIRTE